jgi:outer membrane receptor protein involved in Fe transport
VVLNQLAQKNIPAAYGADLGLIWKAHKNLFINIAAWQLYLEQEFVYVGDEGIVEPSGETSRQGIDLSIRYQPKPWIYFNADANYAHARSINEAPNENFIPLALTAVGNLQLLHPSGWFGGLRCRHMGDRAANETNSIVAAGYTIFDGNLGYRYKSMECGVKVQNVFNTEWNETQFATTSRLKDEAAPVEEIHFTPGTPFNLSAYLSFRF